MKPGDTLWEPGGSPEAGWRPVAVDVDLPEPRTPAPDPPTLPALEYVATLGSEYGRATAMLVNPRDTDSGRLVVHPRGADLDRSLDTAAAYRVFGVPAERTWPAVVAEDVTDGRKTVLQAGQRVEVAHYRGGRQADLGKPVQRAQVARLHAASAALGDTDLRAAKATNLVRDRAGNVGLVDFDGGLELDLRPAEARSRLVIDGWPSDTKDPQKVFGTLTEADLLAGYRHVVERRSELLAVIGDRARRVMVGARPDWMSQVVAAGQLPGWLREQLEVAQRVAAVAYPGGREPDQAYRLGFGPEQPELITSALARMRQEQPVDRPDGSVGNRDPPLALRDGETHFVFPAGRLASALSTRVSEAEAADLVERLVTFAFHDAADLVVAISEDRLTELTRLGAVGPAIEGARRRTPPPGGLS